MRLPPTVEKLAQQEFAAGAAPRTRLRSLSCSIFATQVEGISGYGPPFDGRIELQDADESEFMDVPEGISDKNSPVVNGPHQASDSSRTYSQRFLDLADFSRRWE